MDEQLPSTNPAKKTKPSRRGWVWVLIYVATGVVLYWLVYLLFISPNGAY